MIEMFFYILTASPAPVPPKPETIAIERLVCLPAKDEELGTPPLVQKTRKNKMFAGRNSQPERLTDVSRKKGRRVQRNGLPVKKQEQIAPVSQPKKSRTGKFSRKKRFA